MIQQIAAGVIAFLIVGCGAAEPHPDEEGCAHLAGGAGIVVTATTSPIDAPHVDDDHWRYDVTLPPGEAGYVLFSVSEAADYVFFVGADVPFAVEAGTGAAVEIEESATSSDACEEIGGRHVVPLGVGTLRVRLGP